MGLSLKELTKYKNKPNDRVKIFLDMVVNENWFKLDSLPEYVKVLGIKLDGVLTLSFYFFDRSMRKFIEDCIYNQKPKSSIVLYVQYSDGTRDNIVSTKLEKTSVFGGRRETVYATEEYHYNQLKTIIVNSKNILNRTYVDVKIGNTVYHNITDVVKSKIPKGESRQPKSDFELVDSTGKSVCYISHKKSSKPEEMRQWGGISYFLKNKQVHSFVSSVSSIPPVKTRLGRQIDISSRDGYELLCMSTFGKDYFGYSYGANKVNVIFMGAFDFCVVNNKVVLKSDKYYTSPRQIIHDEKFCPILLAEPSSSRNDAKVKNTRIIVYPKLGKSNIEHI